MYKQVIVVNKSLNMSPGKLGAMVAHGATSFFCEWFKRNVVTSNETYNDYLINPNARVDKELFAQWISGSFTKIVLEVEDDAAMKAIIEKAHEYGMVNSTGTVLAKLFATREEAITWAVSRDWKVESVGEKFSEIK